MKKDTSMQSWTMTAPEHHFVEMYSGLTYKQFDGGALLPGGRQLQFDFLKPLSKSPTPLVVFIKGGGFRNNYRTKYLPQLIELAQRGFAVASIEYRTSNEAVFPAQLIDVKTAVRYFRANADNLGIDPSAIGTWGNSAGGTLAGLLGATGSSGEFDVGEYSGFSSEVSAVVDWYGVTDIAGMPDADRPGSLMAQFMGAPVTELPDNGASANATTYIGPSTPPFLIVHGDADTVVPLEQSTLLYDALRQHGVEVTYFVVQGAGHSFSSISTRTPALAAVAEFFDRHLRT